VKGEAGNYVYGIVPSATDAPSRQGIAGGRLRMVAFEDIAAIVSAVPDGELHAGREDLVAHAEILEHALRAGPVLPMRFGMVMPDAEAMRAELLEPFHDDLAMQLADLDGKVELHVRATYEEEAVMREVVEARPEIGARSEALRDHPPDATYYERIELGQMVAETVDRIREQDTVAIMEKLEPLAVAADVGSPEHERVAAHISFLIEEPRLSDFDHAVDELGRRNAGRLNFKYTGPFPAYSFVELPAQV